jgi:hypothetical protein
MNVVYFTFNALGADDTRRECALRRRALDDTVGELLPISLLGSRHAERDHYRSVGLLIGCAVEDRIVVEFGYIGIADLAELCTRHRTCRDAIVGRRFEPIRRRFHDGVETRIDQPRLRGRRPGP